MEHHLHAVVDTKKQDLLESRAFSMKMPATSQIQMAPPSSTVNSRSSSHQDIHTSQQHHLIQQLQSPSIQHYPQSSSMSSPQQQQQSPPQHLSLQNPQPQQQSQPSLPQQQQVPSQNHDSLSTGSIECKPPAPIENGRVIIMNQTTTYNSAVEYHCVPQYQRIGLYLRKCTEHGDWSGEEPKCERKYFPNFTQLHF